MFRSTTKDKVDGLQDAINDLKKIEIELKSARDTEERLIRRSKLWSDLHAAQVDNNLSKEKLLSLREKELADLECRELEQTNLINSYNRILEDNEKYLELSETSVQAISSGSKVNDMLEEIQQDHIYISDDTMLLIKNLPVAALLSSDILQDICQGHDVNNFKKLLQKIENPNLKDYKGNSLLTYVAMYSFSEGQELLLDNADFIWDLAESNNNGDWCFSDNEKGLDNELTMTGENSA